MVLFWLLVLLVTGLALSIGIALYIPGLLLARLTSRRWFETPGAYLIGSGFLLIAAAIKVQEERDEEKGTNARTTTDEQERALVYTSSRTGQSRADRQDWP